MKQKEYLEFYKKHRIQVYRFVYYRLEGSRELAEDLT